MIKRRTTLEEALSEVERGDLDGVTAIVVNSEWWQQLSRKMQTDYRHRCERRGIDLRADMAISRHYVELASDPTDPPLSTERRV